MVTLYVDYATGNDARTAVQAQSIGTPWKTVARALYCNYTDEGVTDPIRHIYAKRRAGGVASPEDYAIPYWYLRNTLAGLPAQTITVEGYATAPGDGSASTSNRAVFAITHGSNHIQIPGQTNGGAGLGSLTIKCCDFAPIPSAGTGGHMLEYLTDAGGISQYNLSVEDSSFTFHASQVGQYFILDAATADVATRQISLTRVDVTSAGAARVELRTVSSFTVEGPCTWTQDTATMIAPSTGSLGQVTMTSVLFNGYSLINTISCTGIGFLDLLKSELNVTYGGVFVPKHAGRVKIEHCKIVNNSNAAFDYLVGAGSTDTNAADTVSYFYCRYNTLVLRGAGNANQHLHYRGFGTGGETAYNKMLCETAGQTCWGLVDKGTGPNNHHNYVKGGCPLALGATQNGVTKRNTFLSVDPTRPTFLTLGYGGPPAVAPRGNIISENIFSDLLCATPPTHLLEFDSALAADLQQQMGHNYYVTKATNFCKVAGTYQTRAAWRAGFATDTWGISATYGDCDVASVVGDPEDFQPAVASTASAASFGAEEFTGVGAGDSNNEF